MSLAEHLLDANGVNHPLNGTTDEGTVAADPAYAQRWGWFPALTLVNALGLLTITYANQAALTAGRWAEVFFWAGLLLMILPSAMRLVSLTPTRRERIGIVTGLGLALYLVKVVHSPFDFTYSDEFLHLFNTNQILQNGRLFTENPGLPVSALFPGLSAVTAALSSLSSFAAFPAGLIIVGVARVVLVLSFYLFTEQISRSARVAGLAALLYMCHSNFLFWSAQFSYESLSLPLSIGVLYLIMRREQAATAGHYAGLTILAMLGLSTITITHHLSSYFLVIFLVLWWALSRTNLHHNVVMTLSKNFLKSNSKLVKDDLSDSRDKNLVISANANELHRTQRKGPAGLAPFALVLAVTWLVYVALTTFTYLSPVLSKGTVAVLDLLSGDSAGRQLFTAADGTVAPLWERIIGFGSILLSLSLLPFGLIRWWRQGRQTAVSWLLALSSLLYFGMLALRLTSASWEIGNRLSTYFYMGLAYLLALGITKLWNGRRPFWQGLSFALVFAVIFCGGLIAGWPPALRLAQPYVVASDGVVIQNQGRAVAEWVRATLGPNHAIAADEANGRYLIAYGEQKAYVGRFPFIRQIITEPYLDRMQQAAIGKLSLEYVLVDERRIAWDNRIGYFFEEAATTQPAGVTNNTTFAPQVIEKFNNQAQTNRVMDTGRIVIYDVQTITRLVNEIMQGVTNEAPNQ